MNRKQALWAILLSGTFLAAGCVPATTSRSYRSTTYRTYDPSYASTGAPYSGRSYGSGSDAPSYDPYGSRRSHRQEHRALEGGHEEQHDRLDYKSNKAMRRLDRQEREAEEKLERKYGGDTADPRYQEQHRKIDQKYDHKRGKVERNLGKEHRRGHHALERDHDTYHRW